MSRIWNFFTRGFRGRPSPGTSSSQSSTQASLQTEDGDNVTHCSKSCEDRTLRSILNYGLDDEKNKSPLVFVPDEKDIVKWQKGQRTYRNYNSFHNSYAGRDCSDSVFYGAASALFLGHLVRIVIGVQNERNLKKRRNIPVVHQHRKACLFPHLLSAHCILPKVSALPSVSFHTTAHAASGNETAAVASSSKALPPPTPSKLQDKVSFEDDLEEFYTSTKKCLGMTYNVEGIKTYKNGDHRNAFKLFQLGSAGGSMQAQFNLGICYQQGKGSKQNVKQAKKEYNRAAMQGHTGAQYNLALILLEEASSLTSITRGLRLLEKAAESGLLEAQTYGGSYFAQEGVHKNMKKAVKLFKLATDQEDPLSTYHLAQCYEHGLGGLDVDTCKAFDLYASAASLGHQEGQYKMAMILLNGCPEIEQDEELALEIFKEARESGHKKSVEMVKMIEKKREDKDRSKCSNEVSDSQVPTDTLPVDLSPILLSGLLRNPNPSNSQVRESETPAVSSFSDFPVVSFPIGRHFSPLGMHRVSSWPTSSLHTNPAAISHSVKPA